MARVRSIHPGAPVDEDVATMSIYARHLWAYLPCHADREGRLKDAPFTLKLAILPTDDVNVSSLLDELATHGLIQRYESDGRKFIQIRSFAKYQTPHVREAESTIPAPALAVPRQTLAMASTPIPGPGPGPSPELFADEAPAALELVSPVSSPLRPRRLRVERHYPPLFLAFWDACVSKESKGTALDAWNEFGLESKPERAAIVTAAMTAQRPKFQRMLTEQLTPPYAASWLRAERWNDPIGPPGKADGPPRPVPADVAAERQRVG